MLLRYNVNDISMTFDINFTKKRKDILKKLARDEKMIKYNSSYINQVILVLKHLTFLKDLVHCMTY